ncbi:MAG TPA: NAD(P)-dependent oxidoreductase [Chthoniobacterales bacterium]|nr:NAD(P)-dependent oxidoreductase [Chthoniobacterales bacterium]
MKTYIVTGGSGFFGSILKRRLLENGDSVVSIDIHPDEDHHSNLESVQADIADRERMAEVFGRHRVDGVFHVAAELAHAVECEKSLWRSNVTGTEVIAEATRKAQIPSLVFTSSNCLWGKAFSRAVTESDTPHPIETYGLSKWEGEKILSRYENDFNAISIRCPTIIDSGRLGLLAILFEFIKEGRRVWTVGQGTNRYQFIYAQDLASAAISAISHNKSAVFNIGSDNVRSVREIYEYVIARANSSSKVAALPKQLTLASMRIAHQLKLSPLGPYHYKMIAEDFVFDTAKIKQELKWAPTLTNEEMLWRAYDYYSENQQEIQRRTNVSAHKQQASMGVIRLLKCLS